MTGSRLCGRNVVSLIVPPVAVVLDCATSFNLPLFSSPPLSFYFPFVRRHDANPPADNPVDNEDMRTQAVTAGSKAAAATYSLRRRPATAGSASSGSGGLLSSRAARKASSWINDSVMMKDMGALAVASDDFRIYFYNLDSTPVLLVMRDGCCFCACAGYVV